MAIVTRKVKYTPKNPASKLLNPWFKRKVSLEKNPESKKLHKTNTLPQQLYKYHYENSFIFSVAEIGKQLTINYKNR